MPKPDPALLDQARYPFACEITTRFGDQDLNRHINNVALAGLIEESRVRFNMHYGMAEMLDGRGAMIVSISIDYLSQAFYPDPVQGMTAVERTGTSSWTTVQVLAQQERPVAFARSVLVCIGESGPAPLPGALRSGLERMALR